MKWEIGAKMRILDTTGIYGGYRMTLGEIYEVERVDDDCRYYITDDDGRPFFLSKSEMQYVERVFTADDYEMSDAELGEPSEAPSADCNCECDCGNLAEELSDIKAMIGRLIRNGEES